MIELTVVGSNAPALVDDAHADLARFRWRLDAAGYVFRKSAGRKHYLHHAVLGECRWPAFLVDHISRDKLDNRAGNLRWLSRAESVQNRGPWKRKASGLRGVSFDEARNRFRAAIYRGNRAVVRRWFKTAEEADAFLIEQRRQHMPGSVG